MAYNHYNRAFSLIASVRYPQQNAEGIFNLRVRMINLFFNAVPLWTQVIGISILLQVLLYYSTKIFFLGRFVFSILIDIIVLSGIIILFAFFSPLSAGNFLKLLIINFILFDIFIVFVSILKRKLNTKVFDRFGLFQIIDEKIRCRSK